MKALIIGGAGYIGSHVALEFSCRGHEVTIFDNLSSGDRINLQREYRFIHGTILDPLAVRQAMRGQDVVVHLAAFKAAGESMIDPEKYALNNLNGTVHILNAMTELGVPYLVFSSSAAIFGEPKYLPMDEDHPKNPINFYGFTKLEIERLLDWYGRLRGLRWAALRYFNAVGYDPEGRILGLEQNPANLLPVIMEVAVGKRDYLGVFGSDYPTRDGTCIRDYIHVTDLARAHVDVLDYLRDHPFLAVNLGSERGLTVLEMLQTAREVTGKAIPAKMVDRRPGDPASLIASSALAKQLLSWRPKYSDPHTIVETTWKVYQHHFRT